MKKFFLSVLFVSIILCMNFSFCSANRTKYVFQDSNGDSYHINIDSIQVSYNRVFDNLDFSVLVLTEFGDYSSDKHSVHGVKATGSIEKFIFRTHKNNIAYRRANLAIFSKNGSILRNYSGGTWWESLNGDTVLRKIYDATYEEI